MERKKTPRGTSLQINEHENALLFPLPQTFTFEVITIFQISIKADIKANKELWPWLKNTHTQ